MIEDITISRYEKVSVNRCVYVLIVVVADFEVQVYDRLVMAGNTGVLHCVVPSYLREFVTVTSWLIGDHLHVYPSLHGGE